MLPALEALSGSVEVPLSKVREPVAAAEGLTPEDMREVASQPAPGSRCWRWPLGFILSRKPGPLPGIESSTTSVTAGELRSGSIHSLM